MKEDYVQPATTDQSDEEIMQELEESPKPKDIDTNPDDNISKETIKDENLTKYYGVTYVIIFCLKFLKNSLNFSQVSFVAKIEK